jgi:anaerobic magnesium-protoporphyrin IX monomethyl ester cyclase
MNIAFISFWKLSSDGSRLISSILKREGHSVKSIFIVRGGIKDYCEDELHEMHHLLKNIDLVMIGVYSRYAFRAIQISEYIRKNYPGLKIVWGGPHCISAPELSIEYADAICFSEGDIAVPEFVSKMEKGEDYTNTRNMAFNVNGKHIINPVFPLFTDLDSLPYPDFDWSDQFLLDGKLTQMNKKLMLENLTSSHLGHRTYWCLTARGCPHNCSYCNNCRYTAMHGNNKMRFRSVDNFLNEIEAGLKKLDFIEVVGFSDDDFLMRPLEQLEEFSEKYKKRIGLPFGIGLSANTYNENKINVLLDSGLKVIQLGIQSGSQRILNDVFTRNISVIKTKEVVNKLEPLHKSQGVTNFFDFIIDNPYETKDDIIRTYHYVVDLSHHSFLNIFVLSFFPGTPIYDRAVKDGFVKPFGRNTFRSYRSRRLSYQWNYETFLVLLIQLLHLSRVKIITPGFFLHFLGSGFIRKIASVFPKSFWAFLINATQLLNKRTASAKRSK